MLHSINKIYESELPREMDIVPTTKLLLKQGKYLILDAIVLASVVVMRDSLLYARESLDGA